MVAIALLIACSLPKNDASDSTISTGPVEVPTCLDAEPLDGTLGDDCTEDAPECGGDPTGTWVASTECSAVAGGPATGFTQTLDFTDYYYCPDQYVTEQDTIDDVLDLSADGSFTEDFHESSARTLTLPAACMGGYSCADVYTEPACVERADGGCDCPLVLEIDSFIAGTWTTCGATLLLEGADGTLGYSYSGTSATTDITASSVALEYCTDGDVLQVYDPVYGGATGYTRAPETTP